MVLITYTNEKAITYTYSVKHIKGTDYKVYEVMWTGDPDFKNRKLLKRAGPKFVFIVTGDIVRFDFQVLLLQLVSAMGLLSVATIVVETVMLNLLPLKKYYGKVKVSTAERGRVLIAGPHAYVFSLLAASCECQSRSVLPSPVPRCLSPVQFEDTEDFSDVRDSIRMEEQARRQQQDDITGALNSMRTTGLFQQEGASASAYRSMA